MAISRRDFCSVIIGLVARDPNLGIPAPADGLFANLLICDYLYICFWKGKRKGKRQGKREWKKAGGKGRDKACWDESYAASF